MWIHDPRDYFDLFPDADMLVSGESPSPTTEDLALESMKDYHTYPNIGVQMIRPNKNTK